MVAECGGMALKTKRPKGKRTPRETPLRIAGAFDGAIAHRVARDTADPIRQAALDTAIAYLRGLETTDVLALLPVLGKYSSHTAGGAS